MVIHKVRTLLIEIREYWLEKNDLKSHFFLESQEYIYYWNRGGMQGVFFAVHSFFKSDRRRNFCISFHGFQKTANISFRGIYWAKEGTGGKANFFLQYPKVPL